MREKCAQIDTFASHMKNVSFDENEAMMSLIKKKDDQSIDQWSEVRKVIGGLTNVRQGQQALIPGTGGGQAVGGQLATQGGQPSQSPKDNPPFVPELVSKVTGGQIAGVPNPLGNTGSSSTDSEVKNTWFNNYIEDNQGGKDAGASYPSDIQKKGSLDTPPMNDTLSGIRIKKQNLKDSLGKAPSINDNSLLEYFIDEKGYLIDSNGCPVTDEAGKPILLTEDNIKYLQMQNMLDE